MHEMDIYAESLKRPFVIAGPCVLESRDLALRTADHLREVSERRDVPIVFKSSFDKANRTSIRGFRGPGSEEGLRILEDVRRECEIPTLTDIHLPEQAKTVAGVVDVLQIPAFLCRQTDLLLAAAGTGKVVNVKKGQFLAPWDVSGILDKIKASGQARIWLTERGTTFGYNNLVVDFRSFPVMSGFGHPVVFDATHSVQLPGGKGDSSGGERRFVPVLARAAVAAGCSGVFTEVHPDPDNALCDGPNSWPLDMFETLLSQLLAIWELTREYTGKS